MKNLTVCGVVLLSSLLSSLSLAEGEFVFHKANKMVKTYARTQPFANNGSNIRGENIILAVGDELRVRMPSQAIAAIWENKVPLNGNLVQLGGPASGILASDLTAEKAPLTFGGMSLVTFTYEAIKVGSTDLTFYLRGADGDLYQTFVLSIQVQ